MDETAIIVVILFVGAAVGRWWSVVLAIPAGLLAGATYEFEGFSDTEMAVLTGIVVAICLVAGTAGRKAAHALIRSR